MRIHIHNTVFLFLLSLFSGVFLFVCFSGRTVSYVNYDAVVQFCEDYSRDHMYLEGQILSFNVNVLKGC